MAGSLVSPVLVGREAESTALDAALARALKGEAVTVLVGGEAGVGSRGWSVSSSPGRERPRARALVGGCVELGGGGIPYAPVVDMLRMLASELDDNDLKALLGPARAEIGRLVPELDDGREAPGRADRDPSRILELLLGVIGRLAAARPLVLAFEDVQWADPATLDLIALLVAGPTARRLMLVFTVRSDELHRTHPFRRISARWEQQRAVERLELERLSASDVATQIAAILGERPDGALIDLVSERSEGIPLFVEELLGAMREGGLGQDYLPPSLRDVLLARAERLSSDAEHVLRVASCGGPWVPERLLTIVARLPDAQLYSALRETVEHQLLVVDPSGRGYGFRHSLARAAIHDDLLPGERAQLHRLYAEAIEGNTELSDPGLDTISMLAHHWLAAHDLPRALSASVRAGRVAADAYAPSAARRHFELALELWTQVPDADQRAGIQHPELLDAAADAAWRAGAVDRALALVDEALEEVGYGGTLEQRALLLARRASILRDLSRDDEGIAVLEQAVGLLPPDLPSRAAARVLGQLAAAMLRVDQMQRAGELGARAMSAAEAVGATEEQLDAQITVGHAAVFAGEVEAGLAQMRAAIDRSRTPGYPLELGRDPRVRRSLRPPVDARPYEEAVATADEGIGIAEEAGVARTDGSASAEQQGRGSAALRTLGRGTGCRGARTGGRRHVHRHPASAAHRTQCARRRTEAAHADLREVRRHLRNTTAPQFALPLADGGGRAGAGRGQAGRGRGGGERRAGAGADDARRGAAIPVAAAVAGGPDRSRARDPRIR